MHDLRRDVQYALRTLRTSPGFTAAAVLMLAVGIGVNASVFTITNAVLFKGFPSVVRNDRILYIDTQRNGFGCCVSYPDFADWRARATSFDGIGAVADLRFALTDNGGLPETYDASQITANTFTLVGQRPSLGRDFTPDDERPGAAPVAILTYRFWDRRYGKDPSILGRSIRINDVATTVVGVMPRGFSFPQNQDLWIPLVPTADRQRRDARGLWFAFGRLADGVGIENARAEMETIGRALASAYPRTNQGFVPVLRSFQAFFLGPQATLIYGAMWGAVGFVLLIACANLANLTLARAVGRSREMSIRVALGATRWRIVRQLLIESVVLASAGGFFGWWLATWGVQLYELIANPPDWFANVLDYSLDYRVFAYLVAISIGTGLLFGLAPAGRLSRLDVNAGLKDGDRGVSGGRGRRLSALLVIGEMALAVVLLAGAGVMIRSFVKIYAADIGVRTDNVLAMFLAPSAASYPDATAQISFFDRLQSRLEALPGVESSAIAWRGPTGGSMKIPYELAGDPPVDDQRRPMLSALIVSPSYFRTLGASLLSGREFADRDTESAAPVAIVNQRFASRFWPGESAVGKRLRLFEAQTPQPWLTVVGVVSNIVQNDATRQEFDPLLYLPYRQKPQPAMWVMTRTRVPPATLVTGVRQALQSIDPNLAIGIGPFPLATRLAQNNANRALYGGLFLAFAAIALLLASVGLYAVVAHSVGERTREIGIRMAMGATARDILALVFRQGTAPIAIGLAVGLVGAFAVNRVLESVLVRVSPADPISFAAASLMLVASAALGCWLPARRASHVDPVVALRRE
jgi:predicted permease